MISNSTLNKDLTSIVTSKGSDRFKKGESEFRGHLKKDVQVIFDDNSVDFKTTLLIPMDTSKKLNIKLRDVIVEVKTSQSYKITQILQENKVLNRLVLEAFK